MRGEEIDIAGVRVRFIDALAGIEVNVFGKLEQLFVRFDGDVFVFALKKGAGVVVLVVEVHGEGDAKAAHKSTDAVVGLGWLGLVKEKVKVVRHEAVADEPIGWAGAEVLVVNFGVSEFGVLGKGQAGWKFQVIGHDIGEGLIVFLAKEDVLLVGTSIVDVVEVVRLKVALSVFARHGFTIAYE